jgi:diguanylate cyclase (GGDEF)-like protein/PAS domain S-box-containing protein
MLKIELFSDWSIRHKLTGLFVAMASITALIVFLLIGSFDLLTLKRSMARDLTTVADLLARNSSAALTFHDPDAARDVLQALHAESSVRAACIYTEDGKPFAKYVRTGKESDFIPPPAQSREASFEPGRLILFRKIVFTGETLGTIYIESDLEPLHQRFREYGLAFVVTLLITLSLSFFIGLRLQQPISRPLIQLVQTANAISSGTDYSLRAALPNRDEFGMLVSAFNAMLQQIQNRNDQLRVYHEHLEDEVASRTAQLSSANARLNLQAEALNAAANAIVITDLSGDIVWTNPAFSALSGYSSDDVRGKNPRLLNSGSHDKAFFSSLWADILSGKTWCGEVINRRKNGTLFTDETTITPVSSESGGISHFVAIKQDITERKRAEEALRHAEEKYRAIFEDAVVGIFQITPEGRPVSINRALAQMHGYDSPEQFMAEVSNVAQQVFVHPRQMIEIRWELEQNSVVHGVEIEIYCKDRTRQWVVANFRAARDTSGVIVLLEGTLEDITDRKVAEERVQFLAYYDALTGLPNRTLLQDRITTALAGARRRKEQIAVLFIDLDRFKIINDSLGHSIGDLLLQEVAARLKSWARGQDTVSRVGGDEFVVVLSGVEHETDAAVAAQRILNAMSEEFSVRGQSLNVSCSVGVSIFPQHGIDGETLIKNADAAMYCAKQNGPNKIEFFTEDLNAQMVERLTLENGLRLALARNEFFLAYQPQINIATGALVGLEALIRWRHSSLGLVPPDRFIRIAENCGLIVPIGEWVLRTACSQARKWQDEGFPSVRIAVNVSAVQFRQDGFRDLVRQVLRETGLAPQHLELELTESLLLTNADVVFSVFQDLNKMGVSLAIDDFGTGYSSLSYLKQLRVNKLKIDRSFIRNIATDSDDAAITTAIISMAKSLNLKVIAEGVEDEAQMSFLREHLCDEIQGYICSRPISEVEVAERFLCAPAQA